MGVKTTIYLTREEAEEKYKSLIAEIHNKATDEYLEQKLELMNDFINNGEGFENYRIEG